jgi:hypothetical protein
VREQTVTELYRDCKVHCEGAKRRFVSCVKYREIVNYEFNLQFLNQKDGNLTKPKLKKDKKVKKSNFIPIIKKNFSNKDQHKTTCILRPVLLSMLQLF